MTPPLLVAGAGAVTAVGHSVAETLGSLRAGVTRIRRTHVVGAAGERLLAAPVLPIGAEWSGARRLLALARPALAECLAASPLAGARVAVLLCVDGWQPDRRLVSLGDPLAVELAAVARDAAAVGDQLRAVLREEHGVTVAPEALSELAYGHASGMVALSRAARLLESGGVDVCLVGGIGSACEPPLLEWLNLAGQGKDARTPVGLVPGEAAAFLALRAPSASDATPAIAAWSCTREPTRPPASSQAAGLTSALTAALGEWRGDRTDLRAVYADLNGQRERAKEWVFASMRALGAHRAQPEVLHTSDCLGDVSAATAPLHLALAAADAARTGAPHVVVTSSANALRGAAVVVLASAKRSLTRSQPQDLA